MKQTMKEAYVAPTIEVIKMENEGTVMSASGSLGNGGIGNGGPIGTPTSTKSYRGASSSDLEDMINDILTVEN